MKPMLLINDRLYMDVDFILELQAESMGGTDTFIGYISNMNLRRILNMAKEQAVLASMPVDGMTLQ